MLDIILDALLDTAKLLPFLYITYLILEYIEERAESGSLKLVRQSGAWGPVAGAALGLIPQCGFSASAANLFAQGLISAGTLTAVFLSTSDEMLPIMITSAAPAATVLKLLAAKAVCALLAGLAADRVLRLCRHEGEKVDLGKLCREENCGCEEQGIFLSALRHTAKIAVFVLAVDLALGAAIYFIGEESLAGLILNVPVAGPVISALVGLIPNCAASIIITKLYLGGAMTAGSLLAGLLSASGVGLLVLFRVNRRAMADNVKILAYTLSVSVALGVLTDLIGISF